MKADIVMIGHISQDIIIDYQKNRQELIGGAVVHSSFSAAASGANVTVVTKLAKEDEKLISEIQNPSITWKVIDSKNSTAIKNTYFTADKEKREVVLLSQAEAFVIDEIDVDGDIYHLAGLFGGEIPDTFIKPLSERGKVAMDAQGVLRCLDDKTELVFLDWKNKKELLPYLTYFKVDEAEGKILTGLDDREAAAKQLVAWGAKEVMLTHNSEVMIATKDGIYTAPYTNENNSGRTGRGDTTFAAYMAWRKEHDIQSSVNFSAALCSIKMESPGPFTGKLEDVLKRVEKDSK